MEKTQFLLYSFQLSETDDIMVMMLQKYFRILESQTELPIYVRARLYLHVLLSGGSTSQFLQEQSITAHTRVQQSNIAKYRVLAQTQWTAPLITNEVIDYD